MPTHILLIMAGHGSVEENPAGVTVSNTNGVPAVIIRNPGVFGRNGERLAGAIITQVRAQQPVLVHPNAK